MDNEFELNMDPPETDGQVYHDMASKINFQELKAQLGELGFSHPDLINSLRGSIFTAEYAVINASYKENIGERLFTGWFEFHRDLESEMYGLEQYQAILYDLEGRSADMMLDKEITKAEALQVLEKEFTRKGPDLTLYWPMRRADLDNYLKDGISAAQASLEQQLATLGLNDPELITQLRRSFATGDQIDHVAFRRQAAGGTSSLYINIDEMQITGYDLNMTMPGQPQHLRMQYFQKSVHIDQAVQLLSERCKYPELDDMVTQAPMSAIEVSKELAQLALPVPTEKIAGPLNTQLTSSGFGALIPALEQKINERQRRFYLSMVAKGMGGDFKYSLNFRPDAQGRLTFDYYHGCIQPHDLKLIEPGLYLGRNFEPDMPLQLANQVLQNLLQLQKANEQLTPLTADSVKASLTIKSVKMNTENLSYLQKQLLNLGFGDKLNEELGTKIKNKEKEFTLDTTQTYNKNDVDYTLHYKAGDKDDMYFFNKYDAKTNDQQHTFYLNKGEGITAKEAFNLLEGRAVYKHLENLEGQPYNAWITLEKNTDRLKPYTDGWNYKPEKAIDKMDIVGINEEGAKEKLMKSLEKGNRHQVSAMKNGKEVQLFIEANPAEHRVNLTNYKGEAQKLEDYKKPEFKQEHKKEEKQEKETPADDTKKKRSRGKKLAA